MRPICKLLSSNMCRLFFTSNIYFIFFIISRTVNYYNCYELASSAKRSFKTKLLTKFPSQALIITAVEFCK